jgi:hypothetical protein
MPALRVNSGATNKRPPEGDLCSRILIFDQAAIAAPLVIGDIRAGN